MSDFEWLYRSSNYDMDGNYLDQTKYYDNDKIGLSLEDNQLSYNDIIHTIVHSGTQKSKGKHYYIDNGEHIANITHIRYIIKDQPNFLFSERHQYIYLRFVNAFGNPDKYVFDCLIFNGREFRHK